MKLFKNSSKNDDLDLQDYSEKDSLSQGIYEENSKPINGSGLIVKENNNIGIHEIYSYCQNDFEKIGYEDALKNPDVSNQEEAIKKIKIDIQILIEKVNTFYEDLLGRIDLHIDMRKQNGLIDLVMQLESKKKQVTRHIEKITEIQKDNNSQNGITEGVILSYKKGFMLGLSAISHSEIINKIK